MRARLQAVPWAALTDLRSELQPALDEVLANRSAERVLDRFLRARRFLDAPARAAVAESIFGVALWRRHLRAATSATATSLELLDCLTAGLTTSLSDWRDLTSVPDWLAVELERLAGDEAPGLAASLGVPAPIFLRADTLLGSRETLAVKLFEQHVTTKKTRWARDGLEVTSARPNLLGLGLNGHFEVQDEGSQLLAELVDARPGDEVLDLCAGAGGKTLALAAHVGHSGLIHCVDIDANRLDRLRLRAARANARVAVHGDRPPAPLRLSRVLVDAPCSELGVLRRAPDLRWRLNPAQFQDFPPLQLELINRGLQHLAPGGRLVYATCTFRREENEGVIEAILGAHPRLRLEVATPSELTRDGYFATRPDLHRLDGFFAAVLSR